MRSPRALIPLLSVCAAAAVVTAAATGASIEGLPGGGGGPAHADGAAPRPAAVTITAMSWNVCGGPGCPSGAAPAGAAKDIVQRMRATEVGGRKVRTNAVLLQEVCEGQLRTVKKAMSGWSWAFAPSPGGGTCADGQGDAGLAIGTDAELTEHGQTKLPAPAGHSRIALCGEVPSWKTRVCVTQLGTSEDAQWRRKEAGTLATLAGKGRVLIGGDFADAPDSPALDPLYAAYAECDQTGSSRTGAKTRQNWQGTAVEKTDYLFIGKSASVSCTVPTANTKSSDHRPLSAVIRYP
ncbi:endonuclease/exonuclease/phosphatase family protein [Actinomadura madurae]|uniref:endonuclease/exonuclease/phosphatase family protein n=2 Tax=Actinomadura madurae TaxID=1993 RepID=UPI0020276A5E|nr:endonuclease/exonuclease/phosphatase family protein [Actinomadura madurae]URM97580.1 endonuclease/exonuclease/phosphatase family protein [Actinomadura madurae]URN08271.1 endonuclease/exonuclease/phosphatase family protein [Actinomadura madurae]